MSSLLITHDLHLMMIELVVDKIFVPRSSDLDPGSVKKTAVKFRILDTDWITLSPQPKDYLPYNGSNTEEENFYGGKSVLFAIPETSLNQNVSNISIEVHVFREISKYIEMKPCYSIGSTLIPIDTLFSGIIREVKERKEMQGYFNYFHEREPISRSTKETYTISSEDMTHSSTSISIYTRLNYFGKSIITEIERLPNGEFHVREEMCEGQPYQCHEVSRGELETGFWGVESFQPSVNPRNLICICDMNIQSGVKAIAQAVDKSAERTIVDESQDCKDKNNFLDINNDEIETRKVLSLSEYEEVKDSKGNKRKMEEDIDKDEEKEVKSKKGKMGKKGKKGKKKSKG